ncbi:MAG: glutamate racemase [Pseudomonadota bacterium]
MDNADLNKPIGIFDSGIGGLTVFAEIRKHLPQESLIYLGDTARVPYGSKSTETVIRYSLENARFLRDRQVKAIVVACNTASALALPTLARDFELPIIGVVRPGAKAALVATNNKVIGVIGTQATIASEAYSKALKECDDQVKVVSQACPLFVPLVEEGWVDNDVAELVARKYLSGIKAENIDVLVLGCTHYPVLKSVINKVVGNEIKLIDSAQATAQALAQMLEKKNLQILAKTNFTPEHQIYVTDLPARFETIASKFLGKDLPQVKHISF